MTDLLRSARFRTEREAAWTRAEALVARAEKGGVRGLTYAEVLELSDLYQQVLNALSVARAISMDAALLTYLEALSARAYLVIYAPQESLSGLIGRLFAVDIPQAVRRSGLALALAALAMVLGAVVGGVLVARDPSWFHTFVPPGLGDMRGPEASRDYLRQTLFDDGSGGDALSTFATFLYTHNTQIAILVFAVGIFAIVPAFVLTFYNGLMVGAFWQVFAAKGLGYEVTGWLSIHGVTELGAIIVACAGGTQMGLAVIAPGETTRRAALRARGRDAVRLFGLAALMLLVAAGVEGFLRQIVQVTEVRLAIGWGLGLGWVLWLSLAGRRTWS